MKSTDFSRNFKINQITSLLCIFGFIASTVYYTVRVQSLQQQASSQLFVATPDQIMVANRAEGSLNKFTSDLHVKTFMNYMFTHDSDTYRDNVERALHLIDQQSGLRIYRDFEKGELLKNYQRTGASMEISIDSVTIDLKSVPVKGKVYALQTLNMAEDDVRLLALAAEFDIYPGSQNTHNPLGLQLSNFDFIAYDRDTKK